MPQPLLVEGQFDNETEELRREVSRLKAEVASLRQDLANERAHSTSVESGGRNLRKQLLPLYRAMQQIFGELEEIPGDASDALPADRSKWEFLGRKIGGKAPEIIEMLLAQREMTVTQLHKAVRCSYETARYTVRKMREAGIVVTNGSAVSLKN